MPDRPPRRCSDCPKIGVFDGPRCDDCRRKNDRARHDTHPARARQGDWRQFREYLIVCGNVICQRVVDGVRCRRPMYIFHHILPAEARPELAFDWRNVVGVCQGCHPRPDDQDQGVYVPTMWRTPMSQEPLPDMAVLPGQAPKQGFGLWSLAERSKALARGIYLGPGGCYRSG